MQIDVAFECRVAAAWRHIAPMVRCPHPLGQDCEDCKPFGGWQEPLLPANSAELYARLRKLAYRGTPEDCAKRTLATVHLWGGCSGWVSLDELTRLALALGEPNLQLDALVRELLFYGGEVRMLYLLS